MQNINKAYVLSLLIVLSLFLFACSNSNMTIYVSPRGSDNNAGTIEQPLKTFAGARNKVREYLSQNNDIVVYFRDGIYPFNTTVILGQDDFNNDASVSYTAYPGERPVFTSGVKINGWQKISEKDRNFASLPVKSREHVFVADMPEGVELIRFLTGKNSDWFELGKTNVTEFVTTKKYIHGESVEGQMWDPADEKTICDFSKSMENLSNVDSALMFSIYTADFAMQILPVKIINGNRLITKTPGGHRLALPEPGQKHGSKDLAFIHNLVEGIDAPGKFACYPKDGKIYIWPAEDTTDIFAPALNELIRVEGLPPGSEAWKSTERDRPVKNIVFDGITFENCKQPIWGENDNFAQHHWALLDKDDALLRFRGAENCSVVNCTFEKSGGAGLTFDLLSKNNLIENNVFRFLGYEAVRLAGYGIGLKDGCNHNTIRKNEIHHVSQIQQYGAAIVLWNTGFNSISDNYFHHFCSRAILFSAPRSRAFTKNNQKLFPPERSMSEQAWRMARWFEVPDSALATVYYGAEEDDDGNKLAIRRVSVKGYKQGEPGGLIADRTCSYFRFLRGNIVERNVIGYGAEKLFSDGIFYITAAASGEPNRIRNNYIFNTGVELPHANIPFRLIYIDGYSGKFEFTQNFAFNCKFRFEVTAIYNWWDKVESHSNLFYNVQGEDYGEGNLCFGSGPNDPRKEYLNDYREMADLLENYKLNGPEQLPGKQKMIAALKSTIGQLK